MPLARSPRSWGAFPGPWEHRSRTWEHRSRPWRALPDLLPVGSALQGPELAPGTREQSRERRSQVAAPGSGSALPGPGARSQVTWEGAPGSPGRASRTWELHAPSAFLVVIIAVAAAPYVLLTATRVRST